MDMSLSAIALLVALASAAPQQSTPPASAEPLPRIDEMPVVPLRPEELGVSLEKIQRALARRPAIKIPDDSRRDSSDLPLFRVSIEEQKLSISEILGPEFWKGPAPYGGMTHQEFLNMVTPKDVQGYAPFSNAQAATVAITSFALQWGLKSAIRALQDAKTESEREEARKEVQEALEALRKARREAGLPDK
jgi:hypothetical protein